MFTGPGQSAFTRTPWRANSTPSSRDIDSTPPFDAVYEICEVAAPITATKDAVLITDPPPASSRCGMPCLQQRNTDLRFTSCTRCQASSEVSSTDTSSGGEMPALLKRTSMWPNSSRARAYMPAHLLLVRHVGLDGEVALGVLGQVDAHDRRALLLEELGGLGADAARRPRDHAYLAVEPPPSSLRRVVHVLDLAVVVQGIRAELAAVARTA